MVSNWKFSQGLVVIVMFLFTFSCIDSHVKTTIGNLRVEYMEKPIGIDVSTPRFSWQMKVNSKERGYFQTAYQLNCNQSCRRSCLG